VAGDLGNAFAGEGGSDGGVANGGIVQQGFGGEAQVVGGAPGGREFEAAHARAVEIEALAAEAAGGERADDGEGAGAAGDGDVADGVAEFVPEDGGAEGERAVSPIGAEFGGSLRARCRGRGWPR